MIPATITIDIERVINWNILPMPKEEKLLYESLRQILNHHTKIISPTQQIIHQNNEMITKSEDLDSTPNRNLHSEWPPTRQKYITQDPIDEITNALEKQDTTAEITELSLFTFNAQVEIDEDLPRWSEQTEEAEADEQSS